MDINVKKNQNGIDFIDIVCVVNCKIKGKVHPCTGTGALYRPYGP